MIMIDDRTNLPYAFISVHIRYNFSGKVVIVARRMIPLLRGQRQAHSPSAGTAESQMPSPLSWGIGRAATLLETLLQYYGKSLEALPGVAYPGCTLNTKTGYLKKMFSGFKRYNNCNTVL